MSESIRQITEDLWAVEDTATTEHVIWYILKGTKKTLVFDTGMGIYPILPIIKKISDLPIVAVLSHAHFDHVGGAYEIDEVFGWDQKGLREASIRGIPNDVIRTQVDDDFWKSAPKNLKTKPSPNVQYLNDIEFIDIGGYNFEVIYTPGHCPGSVCLYEKDKGLLFAGDAVYDGPIYLHLPESDSIKYQESIQKLMKLDIKTIFPGHNGTGLESTILKEIYLSLDGAYKSKLYPRLSIQRK